MTVPDRTTMTGIVLAGGRSQRMGGRDKAFVSLGGRPMIRLAIERLAPQVSAMAVSANGDLSRFAKFGLPVVADTIPGQLGPLAGILASMRQTLQDNAGTTHVLTVAADTPFFPLDLAARLATVASDANTIAMARSGGNAHPVFALWPVVLADDLEVWLRGGQSLKVRAWAGRHPLAFHDFEADEAGTDPFFNINTPSDLETAEALLDKTTP